MAQNAMVFTYSLVCRSRKWENEKDGIVASRAILAYIVIYSLRGNSNASIYT